MYKKYSNFDLHKISNEVISFWNSNNIFQKSISNRPDNNQCVFYEGPPSANGTPGIHHILARTIKDSFCRYKAMMGYRVYRKGGWDAHGLPVELQVEKELGITKDDIGTKISIEEYNKHCRNAVMKYRKVWEEVTQNIGYWLDLDNPYITMDNSYIESVWHLIKQFYAKGLLYKGYSIQPYSPAAGTGLSTHELNQPNCYREVTDTSIVAQFKVNEMDNTYLLAWTTTPWTLPANAALAVGLNITYVKIKTINPYTNSVINVIIAYDSVSKYFKQHYRDTPIVDDVKSVSKDELPWSIIDEYSGSDLLGITYEQLMPYVSLPNHDFKVIAGDFVTTTDGTGIVHIAPTFGSDDMRVAKENEIPPIMVKNKAGNLVPIVDQKGCFVNEITDFAGMYVKSSYYDGSGVNDKKDVDTLIAIKLKLSNKAFWIEKYKHSYPHCWRTDKPIIYYPLDSWFIRTTSYKDKLIELNTTINWCPKHVGDGRFGNWLENLVDWNISRDRFWGTPLPIWRTKDGKFEKCIGSINELKAEVEKSVKAGYMSNNANIDVDLHRPYIDNVILVSDGGEPMYRETEIIDVWFDSGAMPYAQLHYPFENEDKFKTSYPADFIVEGIDQTRGWFFTLHAISTMLYDSVAFKNVLVNGLVLDKLGNKMSKRLNNSVEPGDVIKTFGPDVLRWYMVRTNNPWENLKFDIEDLTKLQRKFFNTLYNTYSFFSLYASIDNFVYDGNDLPLSNITDLWIISRLNTLITSVKEAYELFDITKASREIEDFVIDDLSNWYVRLNRKRFWKAENNDDKITAYQTLYKCIINVAKLMAPIAPFYAERLYLDLNDVNKKENCESIHLCDMPTDAREFVDNTLEKNMTYAQKVVSLVHSLRKQHKIKVRQPLSRVMLPVLSSQVVTQIDNIKNFILDEVNVKELIYVDDNFSDIIFKKAHPNFSRLGKRYGSMMSNIKNRIENLTQNDIKKLEKGDTLEIIISDKVITLTIDDVNILSNQIEGWSVINEGEVTVALDTRLTPKFYREGIARDLVNRLQNLRKSMHFDVQDKVDLAIQKGDDMVDQSILENEAYIKNEVQAMHLSLEGQLENAIELTIDDKIIYVTINAIKKINDE